MATKPTMKNVRKQKESSKKLPANNAVTSPSLPQIDSELQERLGLVYS